MTKSARLLVVTALLACALVWVLPAAADSWSAPVTVFDGNQPTVWAEGPQSAKIAIDAAGYGVAAFSEQVPGTNALRVAERVPGGDWEVAPEPLTGAVFNQYGVAIDPAGNAIVVWEDKSNAAVDVVEASTWYPGATSWSPPLTLAETPTEYREDVPVGYEFSLSANDAGQFVVAWQSVTTTAYAGEDMTAWTLFGTPTGGFTQAMPAGVVHDNDEITGMTTAIGASGVAAVQWTRGYLGALSQNKLSDIEVAVGSAAGGFAQPQIAVTDLSDGSWAEGGDVAVDPGGGVLSVFWQSLTSTTLPSDYSVDSRYRPSGGSFGPLQKVAEVKDTGGTGHIATAFDGHGNALVTWVSLEPLGLVSDTPTTYTAVRAAGAASPWGAPALLTTSTSAFPQIAEAADGSAVIVFDSLFSVAGDLVFSRTGTGAFDGGQLLPCIGSGIAIAPDDDAAVACRGQQDHSDQIAMRGLHDAAVPAASAAAPAVTTPSASPAAAGSVTSGTAKPTTVSRVTLVAGLRTARVVRGRLVLRGKASGKGAVTITITRRGRKHSAVTVHEHLKGGTWSRTLRLPRRLAAGAYIVVTTGAHVLAGRLTIRIA